ncbi:unnamed protein product [Bursaphelenchus okinawaensis]|uniref:Tyrosine-protein phosphatase domain-containing protein n=1 Tax=Bursaphelenchus okinawaensis TaxID=465554 RepID=A0A811KIQ8_9BILA|nr:unnamed protein product [Bursaphelenchus okinawaensis]CAG9103738.1 unnamed protein product [Bursaphelenchus okinawaensis]
MKSEPSQNTRNPQNQRNSITSFEYQDDGTDPEYYQYRRNKKHEELLELPMFPKRDQVGYFSGISGLWNRRALRKRIKLFEKKEAKNFVKEMCYKIEKLLFDQDLEGSISCFLMKDMKNVDVDVRFKIFEVKFGEDLTTWLSELPDNCSRIKTITRDLKKILMDHTHCNKIGVAMVDALQHIDAVKARDPLNNWCDFESEAADRVVQRIQEFATFVVGMIKWSLLIEPGRPRTDLSEFMIEFEILEKFFEHADLSRPELSQIAFDENYSTRARNRIEGLVCGDLNRVVLKLESDTFNGNTTILKPSDVFGDFDCPNIKYQEDCGTNDFIHANYVLGGPLTNTFILTQAPMSNTINDFWRMIWQEKSEYIIMLCGAVSTDSMTMMGTDKPSNYCPYYWPKVQGGIMNVGNYVVRNDYINCTMDPEFAVTTLSIWRADDPSNVHRIQHWQYDWNDYTDYHWPLRILQRTRTSLTPSVIHCMDGCGRSGTLVLIEVMLMQLLRGSNNSSNPMLTSTIFLRLQRRNAVANSLQYLYAYRVLLHWCEPYVLSQYHRFSLGYMFDESGFCGKFEEMAAAHYRRPKKIRTLAN